MRVTEWFLFERPLKMLWYVLLAGVAYWQVGWIGPAIVVAASADVTWKPNEVQAPDDDAPMFDEDEGSSAEHREYADGE